MPVREREPESPGWYPDPADRTRMRRWDGRRWTGESRALPPWVQKPGAVSGRRRIGRHWYLFGAVVVFLFGATLTKALVGRPDLPKRTVYDTAFIAAASEECRSGDLAKLKDERPKPGTREGRNPGTEEQVAAQVEDAATRLAAVAARLGNLPVAADDRADVEAWLGDWARYVELGREYADAVRAKRPEQTKIASDGAEAGRRVTVFAQANKLSDCTIA